MKENKVLLVDPDGVFARNFGQAAESLGFSSNWAQAIDEAIAFAKVEPPSHLFIDESLYKHGNSKYGEVLESMNAAIILLRDPIAYPSTEQEDDEEEGEQFGIFPKIIKTNDVNQLRTRLSKLSLSSPNNQSTHHQMLPDDSFDKERILNSEEEQDLLDELDALLSFQSNENNSNKPTPPPLPFEDEAEDEEIFEIEPEDVGFIDENNESESLPIDFELEPEMLADEQEEKATPKIPPITQVFRSQKTPTSLNNANIETQTQSPEEAKKLELALVELAHTRQNVIELEEERSSLKNTTATLELTIEDLKANLERMSEKDTTGDTRTSKLSDLEKETRSQAIHISSLQEEIAYLKQTIEELTEKAEDNAERETLENELQSLWQKNEELENILEETREEREQLETKLIELEGRLEGQTNKAGKEENKRSDLEDALASEKEENAQLRLTIEEQEKQLKTLGESLSKAETDTEEAEVSLKDIKASHKLELSEIEARLSEAKEENQQIRAQLEEVKQSFAEERQSLEESLEEKIEAEKEKDALVQSLQKQSDEALQELETLRLRLEEGNQTVKEKDETISALEARLEEMQSKHAKELEAAIEKTHVQDEEHFQTLLKTACEKAAEETREETLSAFQEEKRQETETLNRQIESMGAKLDSAQDEINDYQARVSQLQDDRMKEKQKRQALEAKMEELLRHKAAYKEEKKHLTERFESISAKSKKSEERLMEAFRRIQRDTQVKERLEQALAIALELLNKSELFDWNADEKRTQ